MSINKKEVTVDEIVEAAIVELEWAHKSFHYLWEQYFGWLEEPEDYKDSYHEIAARLTAYKMLVDRTLDRLQAAYGMAGDYLAAELKTLHGVTNGAESTAQNTP